MKKYNLIYLLTTLVVLGCSPDADYESLNKDPNNPADVSAESLFTSSLKNLMDEVNDIDYRDAPFMLLAQYAQQTTYTDESQYDIVNRGISKAIFSTIYMNVLYDLADAKSKVTGDPFKAAQAEVLSIYAWQYLVDNFGDIPYSEALNIVGENQSIAPKYDDAATIYDDLVKRAVSASAVLAGSDGFGFIGADLIGNGNRASWSKFANSLIVKLGVRVPGDKYKSEVEAAFSKSLSSLADNITMAYQGSKPNTHPSWPELVESGRNDYVVGKTIVDLLTSTDHEDPRQDVFFDPKSKMENKYVGGVIGQKSGWSTHSKLGTIYFDPTYRGVLIDYTEICFYLADAAARGWNVGGTAATHYSNGIKASFEDMGLAATQANTYIAKPKVAYTTATGSDDEKIGRQLWVSMFNRGFEGWTAFRRYGGAPLVPSKLGEGDFKQVPRRLTYPVSEATQNSKNYNSASSAIGGDLQKTKVFWDK